MYVYLSTPNSSYLIQKREIWKMHRSYDIALTKEEFLENFYGDEKRKLFIHEDNNIS
jgi:hypothetical protein